MRQRNPLLNCLQDGFFFSGGGRCNCRFWKVVEVVAIALVAAEVADAYLEKGSNKAHHILLLHLYRTTNNYVAAPIHEVENK